MNQTPPLAYYANSTEIPHILVYRILLHGLAYLLIQFLVI